MWTNQTGRALNISRPNFQSYHKGKLRCLLSNTLCRSTGFTIHISTVSTNTRNIHEFPVHVPSNPPHTTPVTETVACLHCETTESMSRDKAVEDPGHSSDFGVTSLRQAGTRREDRKEPIDNLCCSKKTSNSEPGSTISDQPWPYLLVQ